MCKRRTSFSLSFLGVFVFSLNDCPDASDWTEDVRRSTWYVIYKRKISYYVTGPLISRVSEKSAVPTVNLFFVFFQFFFFLFSLFFLLFYFTPASHYVSFILFSFPYPLLTHFFFLTCFFFGLLLNDYSSETRNRKIVRSDRFIDFSIKKREQERKRKGMRRILRILRIPLEGA